MKAVFNKRYQWRILSEDGLLKTVPPVGPYYDEETLDGYFDSEEEAFEAFRVYCNHDPMMASGNEYILIEMQTPGWENCDGK